MTFISSGLVSAPVVIGSIVIVAIAYDLYLIFLHPLANVPGPFWATFNKLWMAKHSWSGDMNTTMIALHEKHGSLVRTGPREVSISDTAAIKTMYGAGTKFRKSEWYSVWQGHRKFDLFAERSEKLHGEQRRLVSRPYSMDSLKLLEPYVDDAVRVFTNEMGKRVGKVVDIGYWAQLFAFDVIGEVTFSKRFGFMDVGQDDGSVQQIERALKCASWIGQVPGLYWLHDFLMPYIGNHLAITARHGSLRTFATNQIAARKDRGSDHPDILSQLLAAQAEKGGHLDDNGVTSMATSNIFAGSDTTAISTRAIIYYLLKNPECKQKLLQELEAKHQQGQLSHPVTLREAENMPYLQAIMYEALRLHPAVGMSLPRVVPEGGCTIANTYLPAGTVIGANPWVIHRNTEVFGQDVNVFRPERWMKVGGSAAEERRVGDMHRLFFAFGSGARMCIGRNISWMEMSKLIPTLFWKFDIELVEPEKEWELKCWWFVLQTGIEVRLRPRVLSSDQKS
ncbi:Putative cytochrome P450 [Septoria linicola]|uniref:Cytochrome P450 n=1 Tax=Septoria linicola TaxID=215465 RepID=A0A9Q9B448_9PEZI|nr:Putative cytochrome P450 [Septoria linicola]